MGTKEKIAGRLISTTLPTADERRGIARAETLAGLARAGHEQLDGLRDVGRALFASEDGRLWQRAPGEPQRGREPGVDAFVPAGNLNPIWYQRPRRGPQTVADLEARNAEAAKVNAQREREAEARRAAARKAAVPVTLGDTDRAFRGVTVAGAARTVEQAGGKIETKRGRLVVSLPVGRKGSGPTSALPAARLLYIAEDAVVAALKAGKDLPEREVLPTGALA
jgi:hypothetical protein